MRFMRTLIIGSALAGLPAFAGAQLPAGYPADYANTIAAANKEGRVVVYSVLSNKAAAPLVEGFKALYPQIEVAYDGEGGSTETYDRFVGEVAAGRPSADVMWSSAMDLQMKLVIDGHAARYESPESPHLPGWAVYRHRAWGTTFEPVVFVYNKQLVAAAEIPHDHAEFARIVSERAEKFRSRVTAFDIEKSGVGYLFAAQDRLQDAGSDALLNALGGADLRRSPGTGDMLTKVASGQYLLGYNIMGAYALVRAKKDLPTLGVVLPRDYTLVLSRVMFISKDARHPNAARLWADYVLSRRGQKIIGDALELFAIRDDVEAEYTAAGLARQIGASARPIPLSAAIVEPLEPRRHEDMIAHWKRALAEGAGR
jgi:iron(III) transport system substrate-binding protein